MKLHTDVLQPSDLRDAISNVDGAWIDESSAHGSRKRQRAYNVKLVGTSNRLVNSGTYGAGDQRAATWDQWGLFLAYLYDIDPSMLADRYQSRQDFHRQTEGKYAA